MKVRLLCDGTNEVLLNGRIRARDQDRTPAAPEMKRFAEGSGSARTSDFRSQDRGGSQLRRRLAPQQGDGPSSNQHDGRGGSGHRSLLVEPFGRFFLVCIPLLRMGMAPLVLDSFLTITAGTQVPRSSAGSFRQRLLSHHPTSYCKTSSCGSHQQSAYGQFWRTLGSTLYLRERMVSRDHCSRKIRDTLEQPSFQHVKGLRVRRVVVLLSARREWERDGHVPSMRSGW